jgi:hypothetical protein
VGGADGPGGRKTRECNVTSATGPSSLASCRAPSVAHGPEAGFRPVAHQGRSN